jgi:hypothetical protein
MPTPWALGGLTFSKIRKGTPIWSRVRPKVSPAFPAPTIKTAWVTFHIVLRRSSSPRRVALQVFKGRVKRGDILVRKSCDDHPVQSCNRFMRGLVSCHTCLCRAECIGAPIQLGHLFMDQSLRA